MNLAILTGSGLISGLVVAGVSHYSNKRLQENQASLNLALEREKAGIHNGRTKINRAALSQAY